uniref:Uncharacterized protein n=1 Tax=Oryza glaberrima TaxID=4538 RepID=I1PFW5_ORYGL
MPPVLPSSTMMASSTLWLRPRGEGGGGTRPSCRRCSPPPSPSTCGDGGGGGGGGGRADPTPDAGGSAVVPPPFPCGGSGEGTYVGGRAGCASAADALPSWRRRTGRLRRTAVRLPPSPRCLSVLSSAASQAEDQGLVPKTEGEQKHAGIYYQTGLPFVCLAVKCSGQIC